MPKRDDDFAFEPVPGLPERLPAGETILWQRRPAVLPLARDAMGLYWVAGYFGLLAVWKAGAAAADQPLGLALAIGLPYLGLGALCALVILGIAFVQARSALYTITTARVAMRIGALTVTFNLPFRQIEAASLDLRRDGTGTIALRLPADTRISYLICWPHVRPWHMRRTEPALRSIPEAARVARILAEAAEARQAQPVLMRNTAQGAGFDPPIALATG
jgi:hypothetical protein